MGCKNLKIDTRRINQPIGIDKINILHSVSSGRWNNKCTVFVQSEHIWWRHIKREEATHSGTISSFYHHWSVKRQPSPPNDWYKVGGEDLEVYGPGELREGAINHPVARECETRELGDRRVVAHPLKAVASASASTLPMRQLADTHTPLSGCGWRHLILCLTQVNILIYSLRY